MDRKKDLPPDGDLRPLVATTDADSGNNIMVIIVPEKIKKPGDTINQLATLDRSKKGTEWPGDEYLNQLISGLPKVNVPEENEPELKNLPSTSKRPLLRRRKNRKFGPRVTNSTEAHRPSLPQQKYRPEVQQECTHPADTIDPWVQKPWETQPFNPIINTVLPLNTSVVPSNQPFNNFYIPPTAYSRLPNDLYGAPSNNSYDNTRPRGTSSTQYTKNNTGNRIRPMPNRMHGGPCMPAPSNAGLLGEGPAPSNVGLLGEGPAPNTNLYGDIPAHVAGSFTDTPTSSAGLYVDDSGSWYNDKPSLLGEYPVSKRPPFTRNTKYPRKNRNKAYKYTSIPNSREGKLSNNQDNFSSNARGGSTQIDPYDTNFNRNIGPSLTIEHYRADEYQNHLNGTNEVYEHVRNINNSGNSSVNKDLNDINYSRFQRHCPSAVSPYEETYMEMSADNSYESNYSENNSTPTNSSYHNQTRNQSNLPPINFCDPIAMHNNTTAEFHNSETPRINFNSARRPNNREGRTQMPRPWNTNKNRKRTFNQFNNKRRFPRGEPNFARWKSTQ